MFGILVWGVIVGGPFLGLALISYYMITRRRERLQLLVEHMASLAERGLPIHTALEPLGRDIGGSVGRALKFTHDRVQDGIPLSDALKRHPSAIPPLIRHAVAIGDRSGNLAASLEELRNSYRRIADSAGTATSPLVYPFFVAIMVNLMMLFYMRFLQPQFLDVVNYMNVELPHVWISSTIGVMGVAMLFFLVLVALLLITSAGSPHYTRSPLEFLAIVTHPLQLRVPFMRRLVMDGSACRFAHAVSLFLRSGAGLPEAVQAAAEAEPNRILRQRYFRVAGRVAEGENLSDAVREERALPDDALWFIQNGEAGHALPDRMIDLASHYDTQTRLTAQVAARLVVPLITLLNGLLILGFSIVPFLFIRTLMMGIGPW